MTAKGSTPGKENPLDVGKLIAGILVTVLGGVLLKVSGDAIDRLEDKDSRTATATVTAPTAQSTQSLLGSTIRPSTTPGPRVFDFAACAAPCDGTNNEEVFPDGTKVIYSRWNYASIPAGADYVRTWTVNDLEWVRYDCIWQGPPAGMDEVELREPMGFHSGEWEISISIDGVVVFQRSLTIEGNNTYWDPAGAFDTCYGE